MKLNLTASLCTGVDTGAASAVQQHLVQEVHALAWGRCVQPSGALGACPAWRDGAAAGVGRPEGGRLHPGAAKRTAAHRTGGITDPRFIPGCVK